ncbi:hypothetical protein SDRG_08500 [Saprolegnia diclina VS20]|uniref:Methyltransferase domain-containing protein n=1 Tax=Saprolegnia diclina (strain VS20) TaxID=1156394 RepID=T0RTW6_SAPDV|nr:hypothetical protein SDRG_08500 [Saprolegnia diclina VS20]EQC33817.1 hypothetical protein SDRG_08500 [Saprolegnia diclina VS20]|eukprot:XP_008612612.1 hypothetical protein SDRG_08500 [Saprolegnia diclina VS20]
MATLAPFNPTGAGAIDVALRLLAPTKDDVVYDIGCGDGRLLVAIASQCGSRCIGIECDASLVQRAHALIHAHGVSDRVTIRQEDATTSDFSDATLLFLYLVPKGIQAMLPMLEAAKASGVRICTNIFSIPSWQPTATGDYKGTKIYLYA